MKEVTGDIWDFHKKGYWIVITTNGNVKANGEAVMGKGIALQAKQRYPELPKLLGDAMVFRRYLQTEVLADYKIIAYPVKYDWREKASIDLIGMSAYELVKWVNFAEDQKLPIYMVRPGCGAGQLDWKDVKPILEKYLDDRFVVVERP